LNALWHEANAGSVFVSAFVDAGRSAGAASDAGVFGSGAAPPPHAAIRGIKKQANRAAKVELIARHGTTENVSGACHQLRATTSTTRSCSSVVRPGNIGRLIVLSPISSATGKLPRSMPSVSARYVKRWIAR